MRTKLNLVTLLLCAGIISHAQNLNPVEIPCTKVIPANMNNFNGLLDANCIIDENNDVSSGNTININGIQNVELKAGEEINLDGEVWVHPNPNGNFYAHIEPSEIGLAWYEPVATPGEVEKFEKLEIGIDLPDDINQYIQNYITNSGIIRLNPFNPEKVDVKAEFWRNTQPNGNGTWNGPLKVYGFYYEEFFENTSDASSLNWTIDPLTTEHKFRVRFAPPQQGLWRCKITVTINMGTPQETVYEASEFTFKTVNSGNPGYVKVGGDHLYLQLGNQTYFPIGRNIPQPDLKNGSIGDQLFDLYEVDQAMPYDVRLENPAYYKSFRAEVEAYKNAGGEEFRMLFFGNWHEIEFEKLNNYYDRLNVAWEFDRMVDHCDNIGLKIYFDFQNHEAFQWAGDVSNNWDWARYDDVNSPECYSWNTNDLGYCYHTDPDFGVETPEEFLTNTNSIKYFQYRLRYIISRWGYSTAISTMELRSEMNNHAKYIDIVYNSADNSCNRVENHFEYFTDISFLQDVSEWNHIMAEYLKTHQYFPHILSIDYTGCPRGYTFPDLTTSDPEDVTTYWAMLLGDNSYYSEHVDVAAYNGYPSKIPITRFEGYMENNIDLNHIDNPFLQNYATPKINKPIIFGESGYSPSENCDQGIEYIKDLWISCFTGQAGSGYNWFSQFNNDLIVHHQFLKGFIEGINFHGIHWVPFKDVRNDKRGAVYCLISTENKQRAIGIIENRTANYYTLGCSNGTDPLAPYNNAQTFAHGSGNNRLMLKGMGFLKHYIIDWFNPITNSWITTTDKFSQPDGDLRLEYPDLWGVMPSATNNYQASPLIAFQIRRASEPTFKNAQDSVAYFEPILAQLAEEDKTLPEIQATPWNDTTNLNSDEIEISPNPASTVINIKFAPELNNATLRLITLQNSVLVSLPLTVHTTNLDVTAFSPGSYLVVIENNGKLYSQKFVKQ